MRISLHPDGLAPRIRNFPEWRFHLLARLRQQVDLTADPVLIELLRELASYPGGAKVSTRPTPEPIASVVVPFRIRIAAGELAFFQHHDDLRHARRHHARRTRGRIVFPRRRRDDRCRAPFERLIFVSIRKESVMRVRSDLCTTNAILHGGSIMAFADTLGTGGTSMNLAPGSGTTTVESSTKFLAAALEGTTITGECTPFHRGRTTMVWQTLVKSEAGKLCAVVTQTQLVLSGR